MSDQHVPVRITIVPNKTAGMMLHENIGTFGPPEGPKLDMCVDALTRMRWHIRGEGFTAVIDPRDLITSAAGLLVDQIERLDRLASQEPTA